MISNSIRRLHGSSGKLMLAVCHFNDTGFPRALDNGRPMVRTFSVSSRYRRTEREDRREGAR
jgi:hypothetical protein